MQLNFHFFGKLCIASCLLSSSLLADTFVQPSRAYPQYSSTKVTPLTPFDEAFKREIQKYPKDTAFFVDGRTGKVISASKLPKKSFKNSAPKATPKSKERVIPYHMQEERIELLQ